MYDDSFKLRYEYAPIAVSITKNYDEKKYIPQFVLKHKDDTKLHIHNEIEIIYIEEGTSFVSINNNEYTLKKGDMVFVNPMEIHSVKIDNKNDYFHKCVCFDLSLVVDDEIRKNLLSGNIKVNNCFYGKEKETEILKKYFLQLFNAVIEKKKSLLFEGTACISMMFSEILDRDLYKQKHNLSKKVSFYNKVINYIAENYKEDITSKSVSEELFYTQSFFCREFHKKFGVKFSTYLNMYRISVAKKLLEDDSCKISDVAYNTGYLNPNYFTRCFKKYTGMIPSKYRNNLMKI